LAREKKDLACGVKSILGLGQVFFSRCSVKKGEGRREGPFLHKTSKNPDVLPVRGGKKKNHTKEGTESDQEGKVALHGMNPYRSSLRCFLGKKRRKKRPAPLRPIASIFILFAREGEKRRGEKGKGGENKPGPPETSLKLRPATPSSKY